MVSTHRTKVSNYKKIAEEPLLPQYNFYIIGTQESPKIVSVDEENPSPKPASQEDLKIYQRHSISSGRYYTLLIEAKLRGKKLSWLPQKIRENI